MNKSIKIKRKKLSTIISAISIIALSSILISSGSLFPSANGQTTTCKNQESKNTLPVLLIHGWNQGSGGDFPNDWSAWEQRLNQENIPFCIVSFQQSSDACGSSVDHAQELDQIIKKVKNDTGQNQVNIVGYSKGGLDARVYLNNDLANNDVKNLIMIGTPNAGSALAIGSLICVPAVFDLLPGSDATKAERNPHTKYHTIAGICAGFGDLLVFELSVNSQPYFNPLGLSPNCHQNLLGSFEYGLAHNVLIENQ
jgi:pimeloyl-ACP methyl ester carboxylesterase